MDGTRYRKLVGRLIYATITRPDISYAVSALSQYMADPKESHVKAAKQLLRYMKGTHNYGLKFVASCDLLLAGYCDSNWANNVDDRRSTSKYCFSLGSELFHGRVRSNPRLLYPLLKLSIL